MAWLERKGRAFRIRFRFGGEKHLHALKTRDEKEAKDALVRFEENCRLIDRGIIAAPPETADLGVYILSGGKYSMRPTQEIRPDRPTLKALFRSYLEEFPETAKEVSTRRIERIHIAHLERLLKVSTPLAEVNSRIIQAYVQARAKESGRGGKLVSSETIHKEVGTLAAVWNKWGVPQGMIDRPAPTGGLIYPKARAKPPFQTREQIEHHITPTAYAWTEGRVVGLPVPDIA